DFVEHTLPTRSSFVHRLRGEATSVRFVRGSCAARTIEDRMAGAECLDDQVDAVIREWHARQDAAGRESCPYGARGSCSREAVAPSIVMRCDRAMRATLLPLLPLLILTGCPGRHPATDVVVTDASEAAADAPDVQDAMAPRNVLETVPA